MAETVALANILKDTEKKNHYYIKQSTVSSVARLSGPLRLSNSKTSVRSFLCTHM